MRDHRTAAGLETRGLVELFRGYGTATGDRAATLSDDGQRVLREILVAGLAD